MLSLRLLKQTSPLAAYRFAAAYSTASSSGGSAPEDANKAEPAAANNESQELPELVQLRQKYELKDKEAAKFKAAYQKSVADFRNLQKTTDQTVEKAKQYALQKFAKDLIESVDNFDLAMQAFPKEKLDQSSDDIKQFYEGVHMVQQVLEKTLSKHGISKIHPLHEQFDPNVHEALFKVPHTDKEAGTIIHVDRTGFKLFDRVLRAPKVGIVEEKQE